MKIILSPVAAMQTPSPAIGVNGLTITIDGTDYDLAAIPEGGQAEAAEGSPFIGTLTRQKVKIRYPYDMEKAEDHQSTNWDDYTFDVTEGALPCPIKWKQKAEIVAEEFAKSLLETLALAGYNSTQIAAMSWDDKLTALEELGINVDAIRNYEKEGAE